VRHRSKPAFDVSVVGLDTVVAVSSTPTLNRPADLSVCLQLPKGRRVAAIAVYIEHVRTKVVRMVRGQLATQNRSVRMTVIFDKR